MGEANTQSDYHFGLEPIPLDYADLARPVNMTRMWSPANWVLEETYFGIVENGNVIEPPFTRITPLDQLEEVDVHPNTV
jgi:hypothetical protein